MLHATGQSSRQASSDDWRIEGRVVHPRTDIRLENVVVRHRRGHFGIKLLFGNFALPVERCIRWDPTTEALGSPSPSLFACLRNGTQSGELALKELPEQKDLVEQCIIGADQLRGGVENIGERTSNVSSKFRVGAAGRGVLVSRKDLGVAVDTTSSDTLHRGVGLADTSGLRWVEENVSLAVGVAVEMNICLGVHVHVNVHE